MHFLLAQKHNRTLQKIMSQFFTWQESHGFTQLKLLNVLSFFQIVFKGKIPHNHLPLQNVSSYNEIIKVIFLFIKTSILHLSKQTLHYIMYYLLMQILDTQPVVWTTNFKIRIGIFNNRISKVSECCFFNNFHSYITSHYHNFFFNKNCLCS